MYFQESQLLLQEIIDVFFGDPSFHFLWNLVMAVLIHQSQSGLLQSHPYQLIQISAFGPLRRT
jgi:hypothetical protein